MFHVLRFDENSALTCTKLVDDMVKLLEDMPDTLAPSEDVFRKLQVSVYTLCWAIKVSRHSSRPAHCQLSGCSQPGLEAQLFAILTFRF